MSVFQRSGHETRINKKRPSFPVSFEEIPATRKRGGHLYHSFSTGVMLYFGLKVSSSTEQLHKGGGGRRRRHGSVEAMDRPAMPDISDTGRLNTFTIYQQLELPEACTVRNALPSFHCGTNRDRPILSSS